MIVSDLSQNRHIYFPLTQGVSTTDRYSNCVILFLNYHDDTTRTWTKTQRRAKSTGIQAVHFNETKTHWWSSCSFNWCTLRSLVSSSTTGKSSGIWCVNVVLSSFRTRLLLRIGAFYNHHMPGPFCLYFSYQVYFCSLNFAKKVQFDKSSKFQFTKFLLPKDNLIS